MAGRPKKITDDWIEGVADQMLEWFQEPDNYWLKDFSFEVTSLISGRPYGWDALLLACKKNEVFACALKACHQLQESKLFHLGLKGKSIMPIFALKNVAAWRDIPEDDGDNEESETVRFVDA